MGLDRDADVATTLRMTWASLLRQKLLIGLCLLAALAAACGYLALRGGAYTASARLLVDNRVLAMAQQDAVYSTSALTPQLVQSQVEILRSEALSRQVIEHLDLARGFPGADEQLRLRHTLDDFKRRLSVEVVGQSHVIEVRFTAAEPKRAADVANGLLQAYLQDQANANAAAARSASGWLRTSMSALGTSARVLTQATSPAQRDGPRPLLVLAFAAFCGVFGGGSVAFLRGLLDRRVRTGSDVAAAIGHAPLAVLPAFGRRWQGARPRLTFATTHPKSRFAHGIARILAAARIAPTRDGPRTIGITGVRPGDGASLIAANVARLAARDGATVLLIDASRFSGTLTELAKDNDTQTDALLVDPWSQLRFASVLQAPEPRGALAQLLDRHRADFDLVVVDLPPLEPVADAVEAAPLLDAIVLTIASGCDDADALRAATTGPLADKLLGVVVNAAEVPSATPASKFYVDEAYTVDAPPLVFTPLSAPHDAQPQVQHPPLDAPAPIVAPRSNGFIRDRLPGALTVIMCALLLSGLCAPAHGEDYHLAAGDKLRLKVSEWPDLAGEYTVGAGDDLSLPVIGAVNVRKLTAAELSANIAQRLQQHASLGTTPAASVEVIAYRPFFVLGDVQKPGEYSYRPSLTVVQAVSIAGGYYRPQDTMFRLERDSIVARSDIVHAEQAAKRTAARIARLEAEQADRAEITPPADFERDPGSADQALLADEQRVLATNKETLQQLLASLDHYKSLYEQEIKAVTAQIATERQQAAAVERELEGLKGLAERGLSPLTRQLATERTIAQISGSIQGLQATILRAQQNIGQTEQRRIEAMAARTTRVNTDLQTARAEAKETAQRLQAARALLDEAQITAPGLQAAARLSGVQPGFRILRPSDTGAQEFDVDRTTRVQPGDVLTVERRLVSGARAEATRDVQPDLPRTAAQERRGAGP